MFLGWFKTSRLSWLTFIGSQASVLPWMTILGKLAKSLLKERIVSKGNSFW